MKIVSNWRSAWKWLSVQFLALQVAWQALPAEAVAVIPLAWQGYITLGLALAALLGRMIDQGTAGEQT